MTLPDEDQQDDLTELDHLAVSTGNGLQPDDPLDQPPQDPGHLPEGTATGEDQ